MPAVAKQAMADKPALIPSLQTAGGQAVGKPVRARETGNWNMAEITDLIKNLIREYDMKAMLNYMAKLVNPEAEEMIKTVSRDIMGRAYDREDRKSVV